jgi:hypothetical protein
MPVVRCLLQAVQRLAKTSELASTEGHALGELNVDLVGEGGVQEGRNNINLKDTQTEDIGSDQ